MINVLLQLSGNANAIVGTSQSLISVVTGYLSGFSPVLMIIAGLVLWLVGKRVVEIVAIILVIYGIVSLAPMLLHI
jgi:hypothetical protein